MCIFHIRNLSFVFVFVHELQNFQEVWLVDSEEVNQHLMTDFFCSMEKILHSDIAML